MSKTRLLAVSAWLISSWIAAVLPAVADESITLESTGVEADARGKARFLDQSATGARFAVSVQRLVSEEAYELVVGGIKVHTLRTSAGGRAKVRFASRPRNERTLLLGFDPNGKAIEVRTSEGEDILIATLPGPPEPMIACCLSDENGDSCGERTTEECEAAGGAISPATSCLPDPCGAQPPVDRDVVCCIATESEPECLGVRQSECAAAGGAVVEATTCAPNPCVATPPPASCSDNCWTVFFVCLNGCTTTYCAPYCQADLGQCLASCPP